MATQDWNSIQQTVALAVGEIITDFPANISANFTADFPQATSYSETRICTEIPFLANSSLFTSAATVTTAGAFTAQIGDITALPITIPEDFGLLNPVGQYVYFDQANDVGTLIAAWPNLGGASAAPNINSWDVRLWCMLDDQTIMFVPPADGAYSAFLNATYQIAPLSPDNTTNYLSVTYPDLLIAGCMVFLTGALRRNYGAQADEPRSAVSWEAQFGSLLDAAKKEELRRRGLIPNVPMPMAPVRA